MSDPYMRLAQVTGDTPPISPQPLPGASRTKSALGKVADAILGFLEFKQQQRGALGRTPASLPAAAGAVAGGGGLKDAGKAADEAAQAPLKAPLEAAKAAVGLPSEMPGWLQQQGKVVGIYLLFVVVGIIGLVFLLSAAGEAKVASLARGVVGK